jgi:hypothetical protein
MTTIVTRAGKGSALTWTEGDANITNLNDDKLENVVEDTTPQLGGNLDVNGNSIVSVSNGDIVIAPNGTGDVHLVTDAVRIGDLNTEARISTYGTGNLVLTTNEGNDPDPTITIGNGDNADITLTPSGTGIVTIASDLEVGYGTGVAAITSAGAHNLDLVTNGGVDSGVITIHDGVNGNIDITPNGTGQTVMKNIEYTEFIHSLGTTSGTVAPNVANGNVQTITLNGNLTLNAFTSPVAGQSLTLIVNTNGTSRTLTSSMKFAGASKTLSTTSTTDIISVFYDGTNYWASLAKGFA